MPTRLHVADLASPSTSRGPLIVRYSDPVSNGGPLRGEHETRDEMRTQYNTQYNVMREGTEHWDRLFRSVLDSLRALV